MDVVIARYQFQQLRTLALTAGSTRVGNARCQSQAVSRRFSEIALTSFPRIKRSRDNLIL